MRAVVLIALLAVLAVLLVRVVVLHADHRISIGILVVVIAVLGVLEYRWASSVAALSRAARLIAPASQGVTCQRAIGTFGYAGAEQGHVDVDENGTPSKTAFISYDACERMLAYLRSDKSAPPMDLVIAVHVLTHEAEHLKGQMTEAFAECDAMQDDARLAQALGATPAQARALAVAYAGDVYPRMPANYTSPDCREDGKLDHTPHDGSWP